MKATAGGEYPAPQPMNIAAVDEPFDARVAAMLSIPGVFLMVHFSVLIANPGGNVSAGLRNILLIWGLLLPLAVLICGTKVMRYSFLRRGPKKYRYAFIVFNVAPIGIALLYAGFVVILSVIGPIGPG